MNEESKQVKSDIKICDSCGGNLVFDPKIQKLKCPYCGVKEEIVHEVSGIKEIDINSGEAKEFLKSNWGFENKTIKCKSCSATTIMDKFSTADFCAFCGSSHLLTEKEDMGISPGAIIPFKIDNNEAKNNFKKWITKRFFAPGALKREYTLKKIKGIYIPCWTYDSNTYSTYTAQAGTYYYVTEKVNNEEKRVRKTRWKLVSGDYDKFYDDVLVNASEKIDNTLMKKLEPWNLKELVEYKPDYISGFLAERYSVELKDGWNVAKNIINEKIESGVINQISADTVRNVDINTSYDDITFKYILLPIWSSVYNFRGKVYKYLVNGQTGEIQGEAPISPLKVALLVIGIIILILAGVMIYNYVGQFQKNNWLE